MQLKLLSSAVVGMFATACSPAPTPVAHDPVAPTQAVAAKESGERPLSVPSDPKAQYTVLDVSGEWPDRVIVTRRVGPSGVSFSKRIYDCSNHTVKYLGDGDTLAEMEASTPDERMAPIVPEAIAGYVGREACKR